MISSDFMILASVLPTKGSLKSLKDTFSSSSARFWLADLSKAVWNGPETLRGIRRLAPASLSNSTA